MLPMAAAEIGRLCGGGFDRGGRDCPTAFSIVSLSSFIPLCQAVRRITEEYPEAAGNSAVKGARRKKLKKMQNIRHLPAEIERILPEHHIKTEEVLYAAQTDLSLDGEMAKGCLLLMPSGLVGFFAEPVPGEVFEFKGIRRRHAAE